MSRNSFRQIEAQINEYEDMRAHARMERNAELRAKLDSYPVADDWMAMMCSVEAHHAADEAISQPSDTSALDSFVAEKVKEIIESHAPDGRNVTNAQHVEMRQKFFDQITTLTRQRDWAVEAKEETK